MIVQHLTRYPVKGLSGETVEDFRIGSGEAMPGDRIYAIENGSNRFDAAAPKYFPKANFLMLMRHERLAALHTTFDHATHTLGIYRDNHMVALGTLRDALGRRMIEDYLADYMGAALRGRPRVVHAAGHSFSDIAAKSLHIVNLASVRALSRELGKPLDPARFRANVLIDDVPAWAERDWIGVTLQLGGVTAKVFARTARCDATNVNPETARRDILIPGALERLHGEPDLGVYAKVTAGGTIAAGDNGRISAVRQPSD